MAWMNLDALIDDFYDLRNDSADGKRYFLNSQTSSSDAWMDVDAWQLCRRDEALADGELITLGFDGSIRDDATALTACRVTDGHIQLLGVWEKPEGPEGDDWQVDRESVNAAVADAFARYEVCGFDCDPPHWQDYVDAWTRTTRRGSSSKPFFPALWSGGRNARRRWNRRSTDLLKPSMIRASRGLASTRRTTWIRRSPARASLSLATC
ncbi:Bacteriophage protein OS=Streptomyces microflavus OX=1919 GN=Smic_81360 PE=4 SV=1 [Streptomyces microflavus]